MACSGLAGVALQGEKMQKTEIENGATSGTTNFLTIQKWLIFGLETIFTAGL